MVSFGCAKKKPTYCCERLTNTSRKLYCDCYTTASCETVTVRKVVTVSRYRGHGVRWVRHWLSKLKQPLCVVVKLYQ